MKYTNIILFLVLTLCSMSCQQKKLPYLGNPVTEGNDLIYPVIHKFNMLNQDSVHISDQSLVNKIHIASFIFLSCPTICPQMNTHMKELYDETIEMEDVVLLSFSIDPKRDTVRALKAYADKIGVKSNKWHFLYGSEEDVLHLAEKSYYATAYPDSTAPGGFTHSGGFLLVDKDLHIRGVYNGTSRAEVKRLSADIDILRKEK